MALFVFSINPIIPTRRMNLDLLGGVGLKTWEQVGSDRKLEESQGGNNWYFDHSKADGDRKGRWIPETTESGVLLSGYMGEKDTGDIRDDS